jgi:predicted ester cyclase
MNNDQNRAYSQNFLNAFPGSKFEILRTIAEGNYVVNNWRATGQHSGPLMTPGGNAIPPTGKSVTLYGSTTTEVKGGKITRSWTYWDMASLLGQLGLMPEM